MPDILTALENSVEAAAKAISDLRARVAALEREISEVRAECHHQDPVSAPPGNAQQDALRELERLRTERATILERIRSLLAEIDRVMR